MSHEINIDATGYASFARRAGAAPAWHGLGQVFEASDTLDTMARKAGLDYTIQRSTVYYATDPDAADGAPREWPERHVLWRSDTGAPLGCVSDKYDTHLQPRDALAQIIERARAIGADIECAMALRGGAVIVATANLHDVQDVRGDKVGAFLNYASSFDGSMQSTEWLGATRIVCNNTLRVGLREGGKVATSHRTRYDAQRTAADLGLDAFHAQAGIMRIAAELPMTLARTTDYLSRVYVQRPEAQAREDVATARQLDRMLRRVVPLLGSAPGCDTQAARGTLWGALNAVTYDVDHVGTQRTADARAVHAMFRGGSDVKQRAWDIARDMALAA